MIVINLHVFLSRCSDILFSDFQQAKEMVMELIREQGFREQRGEYGSRVGGGDSLDVSVYCYTIWLSASNF